MWELSQSQIINNYIVYNILWCVNIVLLPIVYVSSDLAMYVLHQYNNKYYELIYEVNNMIYDTTWFLILFK